MQITLSSNDGASKLIIPVVPEGLKIPTSKNKMEVFSTVKGDINVFGGGKELRSLAWESFFPNGKPSYADKKSNPNPFANKDWITKFNDLNEPIKISITSKGRSLLNMACAIDNFEWVVDKVGNIDYSLSLTEFKIIKIGKV